MKRNKMTGVAELLRMVWLNFKRMPRKNKNDAKAFVDVRR
jgi:hypothetical protein